MPDQPIMFWARLLLRLGLVLLAVGLLPLAAAQFVFTGLDLLLPVLLGLSAAPLGAVLVLAGLMLYLAALLRRRPGSS